MRQMVKSTHRCLLLRRVCRAISIILLFSCPVLAGAGGDRRSRGGDVLVYVPKEVVMKENSSCGMLRKSQTCPAGTWISQPLRYRLL